MYPESVTIFHPSLFEIIPHAAGLPIGGALVSG